MNNRKYPNPLRAVCLTLMILSLPFVAFAKIPYYLDYIDQYKHIAIQEMERTGIPASVKMAQAILESGAGTSTLSLKANNHFGIKCGSQWKGKTHFRKDDDYNKHGKLIESCFRKYNNPAESFLAHSEFLMVNRRYSFLFDLSPNDYHGWATGLKKAGYATSKTYAIKLIKLIEDYELYKLDEPQYDIVEVKEKKKRKSKQEEVIAQVDRTQQSKEDTYTASNVNSEPAIVNVQGRLTMVLINEVKSVKARKGDTPQSIAEAMNNSAERIVRYNEFLDYANQELKGGERIYLQPKRASYRGKRQYHFLRKDETMFDLSQLYGVRLSALYEKNRLNPGAEPRTGSKIKIRGAKVAKGDTPRPSFKGNKKPIRVPGFDFQKEEQAKVETITASTGHEEFSNYKPVTSFSEKRANEETSVAWYEKENVLNEEKPNSIFAEEQDEVQQPVAQQTAYQAKPQIIYPANQDNEEYTGGTSVNTKPAAKQKPAPSTKPARTTKPVVTERTQVRPNPMEQAEQIVEEIEASVNHHRKQYHIVGKGETLYRISKKYGISVDKLKAKNSLSSNIISVGQRLRVN